MNELTILVFLACGQPIYIQYLEPTGQVAVYSKVKSAPIWKDVLEDVASHLAKGDNVVEFKVEDQVTIVCAVST